MKFLKLNAIALALLLPLVACSQSGHTDSQPASSATTAQATGDNAPSS